MRHKLALILANTGLLAVVLVLLAAPLLLGQLLGSSQSGALGVTQTAAPDRQFSVIANTSDFSQYASFNPSPVVEPLFYQTSVTFTAFAGQQASYNGLLTIYNPSDSVLKVAVEGGNLSGETDGIMAWLTLAPENHPAVTLLTQPAAVGAKDLKVADAEGFSGGNVVIGDTLVSSTKKNATTLLLAAPLAKEVAVGDKVYLGAAFYNKQIQPQAGKTQTLTIAPRDRAVVSLSVSMDGQGDQQKVVIPLTISSQ